MNHPARRIYSLIPITLSLILFSLTACDKDDDDEEKVAYTLSATADGAQEVPAVTTDGSGTLTGSYNKTSNLLTYTVSWEDLSGPAMAMHFHGPAAAGVPAGVALPITGFTPGASGNYSGSATINETQEVELLDGKWYLNIHTEMHGGGEIRGQVSAE